MWFCESCNVQQKPSDADLMASGYFRATPSNITVIYSLDVFHLWRHLKSLSPGTSLNAFAMSLEKLGHLRGTVSIFEYFVIMYVYSGGGLKQF